MKNDAGLPTLDLTLLSRRECPLCDEFKMALEAWSSGRFEINLEVVDIEQDAALLERHQWRIPVLMHRERELCHGHFDPSSVPSV